MEKPEGGHLNVVVYVPMPLEFARSGMDGHVGIKLPSSETVTFILTTPLMSERLAGGCHFSTTKVQSFRLKLAGAEATAECKETVVPSERMVGLAMRDELEASVPTFAVMELIEAL